MKLKFKIKGLDCANCANELEESIRNLEEIESVSISFMTETMIVKTSTFNQEKIVTNIENLIKKIEPDVTISLK